MTHMTHLRSNMDFDSFKKNSDGMVPVITQDADNGDYDDQLDEGKAFAFLERFHG